MALPEQLPGIGVDLCAVDRIERCLTRPAFMERVFSADERALLAARSGRRRAETAAANFAAKEAFLKAAGVGLGAFALAELAVLRVADGPQCGAPRFCLQGRAAAWAAQNGLQPRVSLSHEAGLACAFVVLEKTDRP